MRLICPNCGAQYEVPDGVIPEQGRDVQCSNCGNTWFQPHPDNDPDLAEELGQDVAPEPHPTQRPAPEPEPAPQPEPDDLEDQDEAPWDRDEPADGQFEDEYEEDEYQEDEPADLPVPVRRELDPSVAELLREEAEFEARQRAAETMAGLETQPELGLEDPAPDEAARRAEESRRRMASRRGIDESDLEDEDTDDDSLVGHVGSRRELLPDIEEINSSLNADTRRPARAGDHAPGPEGLALAPRASGFRRGFSLGVLLVVLLWALYAFSDGIAAKLPQVAAPLEQYTRTIDTGRTWLDRQIKALLVKLDAMAEASEK